MFIFYCVYVKSLLEDIKEINNSGYLQEKGEADGKWSGRGKESKIFQRILFYVVLI